MASLVSSLEGARATGGGIAVGCFFFGFSTRESCGPLDAGALTRGLLDMALLPDDGPPTGVSAMRRVTTAAVFLLATSRGGTVVGEMGAECVAAGIGRCCEAVEMRGAGVGVFADTRSLSGCVCCILPGPETCLSSLMATAFC